MSSGKSDPSVHQSIAHYLATRPHVRPWQQTLTDAGVWYGVTAMATSVFCFLSGLHDPVDFVVNAKANYFRMTQGGVSLLNAIPATALLVRGRHQVYQDMRDFQDGKPAEEIIARAGEAQRKGIKGAFNWWAHNVHNVTAILSLPLCAVLMGSGIVSQRPGEVVTGALLMAAYIARLRPEKYNNDAPQKKKVGWLWSKFGAAAHRQPFKAVKAVLDQPPLVLSSLFMGWRMVPVFANAVAAGDGYQIAQCVSTMAMLLCLANTTKDGIGRYGGSILDEDNPNNKKIAETLLEGRLLKSMKRAGPSP